MVKWPDIPLRPEHERCQQVIEKIFSILNKLPPVKKEKNPNLAALIGFLFGGIGLLVYGFFLLICS
ncbi:MAG: hypothetical protein ACJA13_000252 [Paraglaciecola sp.]|jgi:hypothetical protein